MARPTTYTKQLGKNICDLIASGKSLKKISEDDKMPCRSVIHKWLLDEDKKEFMDNYENACNIRAENMFDELEEIADKSDLAESPNRSRLRVDTRKWYLSKVMPKKYGDRAELDMTLREVKPMMDLTTNKKQDGICDNNSDQKNSEDEGEDKGGTGRNIGKQDNINSDLPNIVRSKR